jgi:hypothetical protein
MNKNIFFTVIIAISLFACTSQKEGSMVVEGTIKGMKKGMLYLQKVKDNALVSVDSTFLNGVDTYRLVDNVESPELYYLTLNQVEEERIEFFGEKGTIMIHTKLDKFGTASEVTGSKSNEVLNDYKSMSMKFTGRNLEIIKETFEAQVADDQEKLLMLDTELKRLEKNKLRYSASFVIRNNKSEVAPFIALTELYNAHITLLDTVNNSLSKSIKKSKYGLQLESYINEIKASELQ